MKLWRPMFSMFALLALTTTLLAQPAGLPSLNDPVQPEDMGIEEKPGAQVPMDLTFTDASGKQVQLKDLVREGKPAILTLVYFECPGLCTVSLNATLEVLKQLSMTPGDTFDVLTVSFNPKEGPSLSAPKKQSYIETLGKPHAAAGWHFLTGKQEAIDKLTDAVGFSYKWVEASQQFAHASALIILTPEGKVHRYMHGVTYDPATLRLSLVEASQGKIGTVSDKLQLMFCYSYDPTKGAYTPAAMKLMRAGGAVTIATLAVVLSWLFYRERNRKHAANHAHAHA